MHPSRLIPGKDNTQSRILGHRCPAGSCPGIFRARGRYVEESIRVPRCRCTVNSYRCHSIPPQLKVIREVIPYNKIENLVNNLIHAICVCSHKGDELRLFFDIILNIIPTPEPPTNISPIHLSYSVFSSVNLKVIGYIIE